MPMTKREAERLLAESGGRSLRQGANHEIWILPDGSKVPLPRHPGDLSAGVEHAVRKAVGGK